MLCFAYIPSRLHLLGEIELLKELLSRGVPVDSQSESGTPLIWAAGHDQKEAVEVLLEHNADVKLLCIYFSI